jgi:hypothetical protein
MTSVVQSVLLNKDKFTLRKAIDWIIEHNYKVKKIDVTENYFRFRQISPVTLKKDKYINYINKEIKDGIMLVIAYKE